MAINTIELTPREPPREKVSFEEFLDWCDEDTLAEWVDGEIVMTSPASMRHQDVGSLLETVMRIYAEARGLGKVMRAPFVMRLAELARGREPDLLFVARERLHLLGATYLDGPADLAVEIISPESIGRDRGEKFVEYERAGIKEYWLIDPDRQSAEFYELRSDGRYHPAALGADGIYRSQIIPGFWLRVEWLWQTPLPPALEILRELKIV
jgi:Uma2 family endonuclease